MGVSRTTSLGLAFLLAACAASSDDDAVSSDTSELNWEPISAAMGNPPNYAQLSNGSMMSVVSREWGRGAKAGALVELYYPQYGADNLWDSYVGVRANGMKLSWAHDFQLRSQRLIPDSGLVVTTVAKPGLEITIEDVVRPKNNAHVRRVLVKNTGTRALENTEVAFYSFYTLNGIPDGDRIRLDPSGALIQTDQDIAVATIGNRPLSVGHCGRVFELFGDRKDARMAAEGNDLVPCTGVDPAFAGVNGTLVHKLDRLAPNETKDITYAIGMGGDDRTALNEAKAALTSNAVAEDRAQWASVLARAPLPPNLPADARDVYKRAVVTVMQHRVDNGGFIAASTLTSPVYKLIWPRDGSKTAVDMLEAGFESEAKQFFELLETLLRPDGSFAINYVPSGSGAFFDFGASGNENDQPGMLLWGVERVFEKTHDNTWLAARWPAIERTANHLLSITPGGKVAPSRDLWELETGGSWTYAQGSAIAGLEAAGRIAQTLGKQDKWSARATEMRGGLQSYVAPGGYFARGVKDGKIDERVEIANLALGNGGFHLLPDSDPRIKGVADRVASRLMTRGGAVRRYEGDRYYGGQPWPVASVWLALHRLANGDRAGAVALFNVLTNQARATSTLMLGEQFDEEKKQWLSAVPLVWSEAAYIRLARALF